MPRLHARGLQLSLLASEPEVVTPVGLAADQEGRLFVVESHTHQRRTSYEGPKSDRILVFEDTDGDQQLDRSRIYADGFHQALAIAFSADNELYVVQMKSVVVLRDKDGDGKFETHEPVLTIDTANNNHHGVFLAIALDDQNRMYVSLGNINGSFYSIRGSDDSRVDGQGDTGLIVRCRADGSSVERYAHGFWNPPDLKFDTAGRLLATDNDPDSRGPNRVLHVVRGGQYGFKSRFGGSGLHPFCSWNGELPGTLPMLVGVGEAPVGLLDCNTTSLPEDFADDLLVAVWGTNQVVRVHTEHRGASLAGRTEPLIVGDQWFRPTGIAATADGTVYIADWADRRYPVHGKGRIWRLSTRPGTASLKPVPPFESALGDAGQKQLAAIGMKDPAAFDQLVDLATQADPFVANAAVVALTDNMFRQSVLKLLQHKTAAQRLTALLTLRKAHVRLDGERMRHLLTDDDFQIRKMTMIWIGESMRLDLARDLRETLPLQTVSADLFETFLATVSLLTEEEVEHIRTKKPGHRIKRVVDSGLLTSILADADQNALSKAMAVRYLKELDDPGLIKHLASLAESNDIRLASEVIRTMSDSNHQLVGKLLSRIALDTEADVSLRSEAIMSFVASPARGPDVLLPLLFDENDDVVLTAVRGLTPHTTRPSVRKAFSAMLADTKEDGLSQRIIEQIRFALRSEGEKPEMSDSQWKDALSSGDGDANAGSRVFYDRRTNCSKCHAIHGRGGSIGPGLSRIASAKTPNQILESILQPSRDMSPDYQGYFVVMNDGRVYKGIQFHFRGENAELQLETGELIKFALSETEEYGALKESLMPSDLVHSMSIAELRDLLAFLGTLGSNP